MKLSVDKKEKLIQTFYFKPGVFSPTVTSDISLFVYARTYAKLGSSKIPSDEQLLITACFVISAEVTQLEEDLNYADLMVSLLSDSQQTNLFSVKKAIWSAIGYKLWFKTPMMLIEGLTGRDQSQGTKENLPKRDFSPTQKSLTSLWVVFQLIYLNPTHSLSCVDAAIVATNQSHSPELSHIYEHARKTRDTELLSSIRSLTK